ncbi:ParB-like nuclease family protein [Rhizobium sp. PP-F2F-G48]|uniref:ParB N-terminal domain-containing protein n=1 Tax=Rhizobium sp. PP-F2F-G48 TaxID=2135651 RepID=UPI0010518D03|nr:ParB N-terminal domain-containing protein [Rhizobium sp. PP-F2F-G48]TCM51145.1 ParB-like nuclease family protein [Rhizobium sp. PP-F2F-G48]
MDTSITIYSLVDPQFLQPTEDIDPARVSELQQEILSAGRWTQPVSIHKDERFVMDGHHRLAIAQRLGLKILPVVLLDYDRVGVTAWREGETITPDSVFAMARSGRRFPCKTTRHIFRDPLPHCDIALDDLRHPPLLPVAARVNTRTGNMMGAV